MDLLLRDLLLRGERGRRRGREGEGEERRG